jgi:hypothetical protein
MVFGKAEIRFLQGKITFQGYSTPLPTPLAIVIYKPKDNKNI